MNKSNYANKLNRSIKRKKTQAPIIVFTSLISFRPRIITLITLCFITLDTNCADCGAAV